LAAPGPTLGKARQRVFNIEDGPQVASRQRRVAEGKAKREKRLALLDELDRRVAQHGRFETVVRIASTVEERMNREQVTELHYITPIENLPSIVQRGILCHRLAARLPHRSVAMAEVQDIRHGRVVPPGPRTIHDFANLYFHARNPMLFKRKDRCHELAVVRVSPAVLDLPYVVLTDQNAASSYARFMASPAGLPWLDADLVFARDWRDADQVTQWRKKSAKCAEALVPDQVEPRFIMGAYVASEVAACAVQACAPGLNLVLWPDLFFLEPR
jgi:hypothetical protein